MTPKIKFLVVAFIAHAFLQHPANAQDIRGVVVSENQVAVSSGAGGLFLPITHDDAAKALPVWSNDGTHIAYIEKRPDTADLAKLVVIDTQGQVMSTAPIKPVVSGEVRSGMRYVESVQWITPSRIVVAGSVNPTTTEYNIVDVGSGSTVKEFFDDGSGASFSPDGLHYAYVTGAPHFTPASERRPTLKVDGKSVSIATRSPLEFVDVPVWSPDSRFVAVLVKYAANQGYSIAVAQPSVTAAALAKLPFEDSAPASVYWAGDHLYVTRKVPDLHPAKIIMGKRQFITETYMLQEGEEGAAEPWSLLGNGQAPVDTAAKAKEFRAKLKAAASVTRGSPSDFWCANCDLSILPRRTSAPE